MNIFITFENKYIPIHAIDLFRTLRANGHALFLFIIGQGFRHYEYNLTLLGKVATILTDWPDLNEMNIWMYDLTARQKIQEEETQSWDLHKTPFLELMEKYKGRLVCINYEDHYDFFLHRVSGYVIDKTDAFINNALYKDPGCYDARIRNKLVLTTSYITNSQKFKTLPVPFNKKENRSVFTGNLTGFSEYHKDEYKCRVLVPLAVIKAKLPCRYRIYDYDPTLKGIFEQDVPEEYKTEKISEQDFVSEFSLSKYILSLRGMGYTVNRFFEGHAAAGLVFSTQFNHRIDFIGQGEENIHYIHIDWSGKDVVEKIKYYMKHKREAKQIATQGRKLWEEYSMLDEDGLLPEKVRAGILKNIYKVSGIPF